LFIDRDELRAVRDAGALSKAQAEATEIRNVKGQNAEGSSGIWKERIA